ncbi:ATP synthase subunit I [Herbaspirillum sp. YR522]|uniref:ATP synthase subunit I n=1 Tax=Herbaspirillum sp. YR522 TaxID=1144342 RepID=UPI00026FA228|nr:ATP synthase subunit I [Herbaspirillum sp. YR522]EJN09772.1 F0F1-type ATP synthase, subunit I [Herbaspirillum sp. YR522]
MLRIILLQLVTTVVVALVASMLGGLPALWSALLGGICCVVPNALFALRLFVSARKPGGTDPMAFFFGEFIKIATTFALMGAIVWLYHGVNWLAFLLSFIVVLKSYFILLFRHRP